jgi:hypothetical protein
MCKKAARCYGSFFISKETNLDIVAIIELVL